MKKQNQFEKLMEEFLLAQKEHSEALKSLEASYEKVFGEKIS